MGGKIQVKHHPTRFLSSNAPSNSGLDEFTPNCVNGLCSTARLSTSKMTESMRKCRRLTSGQIASSAGFGSVRWDVGKPRSSQAFEEGSPPCMILMRAVLIKSPSASKMIDDVCLIAAV